MPNSQVIASIPTVVGVRANGDGADVNPVIPDILVRRTAADIRSGLDPALERAKNCLPRSVR
jgi:hypothetical protein